jgi:hypothetical protein
MYHGIEIGHPIYAVLFANIGLAAASAVVNVVSVFAVDSDVFLVVANASNTWCLFYRLIITYL